MGVSSSRADHVPLVTVVMPAYNHARYVVEAIESVCSQTFEDWTLVVIDDGSTDETLRVVREHAAAVSDSRISVRTQSNAGSHATLNAGLNGARSRYLAILNSDDRYAPDRLEQLIGLGESEGSEIFITTGVRLIDADGAPVDGGHWWQRMYEENVQRWTSLRSHPDNPDVQALLWGNFTVTTSNFFMSRAVWERTGAFRPLRYVPDWDYVLRVASSNPAAFRFIPRQTSLDYRLHGSNTILGGALKNHVEASHVLRAFQKRWVSEGHLLTAAAIDRLHYLDRFARHEHTRQLLERNQAGWVEQLSAERARRDEPARLMRESRSWRLTRPLRWAAGIARDVRGALATTTGGIRRLTPGSLRRSASASGYHEWLEAESAMLAALREKAELIVCGLDATPLVSILMPVHDTPPDFLRAAVSSVQAQWYPNWELCVCDDASTRADTRAALESVERSNPKIRLSRREQPGHVALATNDALGMARGDFVVFLDHDDELAPHALLRLVQEHRARPELDFIYSDEDKIDASGRRCLPLFKPGWSPALLWSQNYVGHLMFVRRSLLLELGGLRPGTQGSQDHDLVLRLAETRARIAHLPEVLYHWRMHPGSTSSNRDSKPYASVAAKEAVARHLAVRYGPRFVGVDDGEHPFVYLPRFKAPADTLVSIVIPTRDHAAMLAECIDSIRRLTVSARFEIVVLDNGSREPRTRELFDALRADSRVRIVQADIPFNWSRLNNIGRQHALGQVLVFLNNDTLVISPDWLLRLSQHALLPDVATVGPMLLYPDGTIQHAGVVVGMGGWADHVFKGGAVVHFPSPFISSMVSRNVLANTGACVAIETAKFDQLGGFDEGFQICGSDVDLGIRAHRAGLQNIFLPQVRLHHLESKTRTAQIPTGDFERSAASYAPYRLEGDPYFNPNLDANLVTPTAKYPARALRALSV